MFCPVCQAEYREGFTRCSDCDVDLVPSLASTDDVERFEEDDPANPPYRLWRGDDKAFYSQLISALENAEVSCLERRKAADPFTTNMSNALEVWVPGRDRETAEDILATLSGVLNEELPPEIAEPETSEESVDAGPKDLPDNWDPADATTEVWSGERPETATFLTTCLRENGIESMTQSELGKQRILVQPDDEARAREIVREISEGTPPV